MENSSFAGQILLVCRPMLRAAALCQYCGLRRAMTTEVDNVKSLGAGHLSCFLTATIIHFEHSIQVGKRVPHLYVFCCCFKKVTINSVAEKNTIYHHNSFVDQKSKFLWVEIQVPAAFLVECLESVSLPCLVSRGGQYSLALVHSLHLYPLAWNLQISLCLLLLRSPLLSEAYAFLS